MTACPDMERMLHALVDNELDAGHVLEVESHVAGCAACASELGGLHAVKAALGEGSLSYTAPPGLAARIDAAIAEDVGAPRARAPLASWLASAAAGAIAAGFAILVLRPGGPTLESQLIEAQARSLQAQHLVDVPTSDRHVVKPWFNGKIDFAPPVVDLAAQGYPLVGGRLDHVDGRPVAALVFRRRAHVINLFIWPGQAPADAAAERSEGYNLVRWGTGGLVYWAVSDVDSGDLSGFQRLYLAQTR